MANLNETATWEAGIYQWETSDPVQGGPNGIDNKPTRQLANRTLWLKTEIAKAVASIGKNKTDGENMFARKTTNLTAGAGLTGGGTLGGNVQFALGTPGTCSGNTTNWAGSDTHTHQLAAASPTVAGVAKLINNLTTDDADSALSAAMGKKLAEEKIPNTTQDFMRTLGEFNPGKSGFVRTNGGSLNGNILPSMEIHIGHPGYAHGAHSRGIGFAYGTSWGIYTTAWDGTGNYRGYKEILTEENGVMLTGNQTVNGVKTFAGLLTAGRAEHWSKMRMPVQSGGHWFLEANPQSNLADGATLKFNIKYEQESGQVRYIHFPELGNNNHMVAYQDWVTTKINAATGAVNDKIANATPSGMVAYFAGANPPPGWLKANGAAVSRTTYAALFAAIGTTYGAGDGRTTFNLPDLRGEFVRGLDDGRGIDSGRALGSRQIGTVVGADSQDGAATIGVAIAGIKSNYAQTAGSLGMDTVDMSDYSNARLVWSGGRQSGLQAANPDSNGHFSGVARPRNIALLACIKI
ncbi:phage tail protein [Neisseria weaveri]|uniref:Putative phage tail fiber protein n=1 Tax=Neisseria weaveri TaxID=28091 RepID=A0A448VJM8_9NEIS|nr:phage tail protein [Neisseria weaveri]EGV38464.1 hypothetical protein l11_04870 [Neisseria weaveri LMG 5135]VEJ49971.1 putative phage tail fiber protein [Neisseria weaveri]